MKTILYMATSIDGKITIGKSNSSWVTDTDWGEFTQLMHDCGNIVMGRHTYHIWGDDFPAKGVTNVVMTSQSDLLQKPTSDQVIFTDKSPKEVISLLKNKDHHQVMLIGGQALNTSFLQQNLIDEIWLSIHPLLIGDGLSIIDSIADHVQHLQRIQTKDLAEDLVQIRYRLKK